MTDPRQDPNFVPFRGFVPEPVTPEVAALRTEIAWLRETHRHMINQLVARYELVPPAPVVWPGVPPLRPDQPVPNTQMTTIHLNRLSRLLDIEKAAERAASPIVRSQYGATGVIQVPLPLMTELVEALNEDQPCK